MFSKVGSIVIVSLCLIKMGNNKDVDGFVEVFLASLVPLFLIWVAPASERAAKEWVKRYGWNLGMPHPYGLQIAYKGFAWFLLAGIFLFVYV